MSSLSCQWLSGPYAYPSGRFCNLSSSNTSTSSLAGFTIYCSNSQFTPRGPESSKNDLKFVLHDALDASGVNTTNARIAREGFCSQIRKLSNIERETSICINRGVDLGKAALHIAAEDDSLVSHSSVPLPVDDFLERLDHLSMGYCSRYSSSRHFFFFQLSNQNINIISLIAYNFLQSCLKKKPEEMDLFYKAKAVRLRSYHEKYLTAEEDEETVIQDRDGASKNATWTVEFVNNAEKFNTIRLKSCYNKYLTASNQRFLLGMTGRKVLQTLPQRLDSSVEWEPIREGNQVKLRTRKGQFLRANDSIPPWRNSVTHNIPHRTSTQDWVLWDVDVVEILVHSPVPKEPPPLVYHDQEEETNWGSESTSPSSTLYSASAQSFSRQESGEFMASSLMKFGDGRLIYYHIANEYGEINDGVEGLCIPFKGNSVEELTKTLEEETGLEDITVCTKSPLNGKLYPLRLQLPPNNANMDVVVVPSGLI